MSTVANCANSYLSLIKDSDVKLEFLTEMRIEEWSQLHLASKDYFRETLSQQTIQFQQ